MDNPITAKRIAEIRAREQAATRGPLRFVLTKEFGEKGSVKTGIGTLVSDFENVLIYTAPAEEGLLKETYNRQAADGAFFAHSRTDIPDLLEFAEKAMAWLRLVSENPHQAEHAGLKKFLSDYEKDAD